MGFALHPSLDMDFPNAYALGKASAQSGPPAKVDQGHNLHPDPNLYFLLCFWWGHFLVGEGLQAFPPTTQNRGGLTVITNKIYKNIDKKQISLLTLCDLSKTFDSVNHHIPLEKLWRTSIGNFWFDDY